MTRYLVKITNSAGILLEELEIEATTPTEALKQALKLVLIETGDNIKVEENWRI